MWEIWVLADDDRYYCGPMYDTLWEAVEAFICTNFVEDWSNAMACNSDLHVNNVWALTDICPFQLQCRILHAIANKKNREPVKWQEEGF
jgi:hypothetical protein